MTPPISTTPISTTPKSTTPKSTTPNSTMENGPRTGRITPMVALMIAAVLFVAAGVLGVTLGRPYFAERDLADQGAKALASGKQLAVNFVSMDYRTFDAYSTQVLSGASGSFHDDYASKLADLKKVVLANEAVSAVKRVEAGLVSADADSAVVIVGVVADTSNTATKEAVAKTYRMRLDLQKTSDANAPWKVITLDFVG